MANTIWSSAGEGDGDDIENVCSHSDTNGATDDRPEPPHQAAPQKSIGVAIRHRSVMPASQDSVKGAQTLDKDPPNKPTAACTRTGPIPEAEKNNPGPQNTTSPPQPSLLELKNIRSGSGDEGVSSAPEAEAKNTDLGSLVNCSVTTRTSPAQLFSDVQQGSPSNGSLSPQVPNTLPSLSLVKNEPFDARPLEAIVQEHQDRTVQNFHVIARGLDHLNMELQFIFSEFLLRKYAQIDDQMKLSLSEIQCQEKEQERLLNQMVSFLNAMKNAFAIFGGSQ